jgi:predicted DNA binding CopG/RHH family protein
MRWVTIRLPEEVIEKIERDASLSGRSFRDQASWLLERCVRRRLTG